MANDSQDQFAGLQGLVSNDQGLEKDGQERVPDLQVDTFFAGAAEIALQEHAAFMHAQGTGRRVSPEMPVDQLGLDFWWTSDAYDQFLNHSRLVKSQYQTRPQVVPSEQLQFSRPSDLNPWNPHQSITPSVTHTMGVPTQASRPGIEQRQSHTRVPASNQGFAGSLAYQSPHHPVSSSGHVGYQVPTTMSPQITPQQPRPNQSAPEGQHAPGQRDTGNVVAKTVGKTPARPKSGQDLPSRKDLKRLPNLAQPLCDKDAAVKATYDPTTIARDVLITSGKHPTERVLNDHFETLRKNVLVDYKFDLETFRWDLVDPLDPVHRPPPSQSSAVTHPHQSSLSDHHHSHPQQEVVITSPSEMPRPRKRAGAKKGPAAASPKPPPEYQVFRCTWPTCPSELHNMISLQRHLLKVHIPNSLTCGWVGCENTNPMNATDLWEHVQGVHLRQLAWILGDGPRVTPPANDGDNLPGHRQIDLFCRSARPETVVLPADKTMVASFSRLRRYEEPPGHVDAVQDGAGQWKEEGASSLDPNDHQGSIFLRLASVQAWDAALTPNGAVYSDLS
ncbi:hypothetical protein N7492_001706 [Penicillium capsulatum]|uniref:C2H2-type domain-containing protein n=1 Tax=Penicillium capsulatum TaxID=69766 RepID=A0A9W9M037_9EURO|nr:hypothetical protein N7492_001706 [Penicillium capsulatum]KAJ6129243.1 hypothetical protein N7512_002023 [Penicillium capsulatum]